MFRRKGIELCFIKESVATEGIDGEITDAKGGEVLEEMSALAGVNAVVFQSTFYDDACSTDVGPFYGKS